MSKQKVHTLLASMTTVIGIVLAAGMVIYESEPGLIPLLLVVIGIAWFFIARFGFPPRDK
ncbi:MAG: hypothetical protein V4731_00445 [Pseudomonadota bacterium]